MIKKLVRKRVKEELDRQMGTAQMQMLEEVYRQVFAEEVRNMTEGFNTGGAGHKADFHKAIRDSALKVMEDMVKNDPEIKSLFEQEFRKAVARMFNNKQDHEETGDEQTQ